MKTSIQSIHLGTTEFHFFFNQDDAPVIEAQGIIYKHPRRLCEEHPELLSEENLEKLAQILNFLLRGLEFQFISQVDQFQKDYEQDIETQQINLLEKNSRVTVYGPYDTSKMHSPKILKGKMIFFVKHDYHQIPYKVTLSFPIASEILDVYYELLPIL